MTSVYIGFPAQVPFRTNKWIRNGSIAPDATLITHQQEEANRAARFRLKEWGFASPVHDISPASTGLTVRWRARIRTSKHHDHMIAHLYLAATGGGAVNPFVNVRFTKVGTATVTNAEYHGGLNLAVLFDMPDTFRHGETYTKDAGGVVVQLEPDTEYDVQVEDNNKARTIACVLFEADQNTDTDNGYLASGVAAGDPILQEHREDLAELLRAVYNANGAPIITWSSSSDSTAATRTDPGPANLIDDAFDDGPPDSSWPGFFLPLENHGRVGRATVPCEMRVLASCESPGTGHVYLTDADGVDIADVEVDVDDPDFTWFSVVFDLPAEDAFYYLRFAGTGSEELVVRAVDVYQYLAP